MVARRISWSTFSFARVTQRPKGKVSQGLFYKHIPLSPRLLWPRGDKTLQGRCVILAREPETGPRMSRPASPYDLDPSATRQGHIARRHHASRQLRHQVAV